MKLGLYVAFDKVANKMLFAFSSASDSLAVRENAPNLSKIVPLGDVELRKVAEIDDTDLALSLKIDAPAGANSVLVPWDCYEFPESPIKREAAK